MVNFRARDSNTFVCHCVVTPPTNTTHKPNPPLSALPLLSLSISLVLKPMQKNDERLKQCFPFVFLLLFFVFFVLFVFPNKQTSKQASKVSSPPPLF